MKFCVINGSPKGNNSITIHTLYYLEKLFPEHSFEYLNIGQQIKYFEKDLFKAINKIEESDVVIFSYPVYTFIAPSQLHRFIELLKENNFDFNRKYVTQITTSKHFYDITAHNYIEENCADLNAKVIKGLSLDMEDLTKENGQESIKKFFNFVLHSVDNDIYENIEIQSSAIEEEYIKEIEYEEKNNNKEVVIVADIADGDDRLKSMIEEFIAGIKYSVKIYNIRKFEFAGGCLGCFNCAGSGKCIYKDNFDNFLRGNIQSGNAIVYAFSIKDHSMGALFKMFDDRQFCNGHRTVTEGTPVGYIINGDINKENNLKTILQARAEVGGNYLAGLGFNNETIKSTINKLNYSLENNYYIPRNFYCVGGMKIFRDLIWVMRGIMKADHEFYKKHRVYDFPQKERGKMLLMCILGAMIRNPKIKAKMGNKFTEGMVAPYKKVIESMEKESKNNA